MQNAAPLASTRELPRVENASDSKKSLLLVILTKLDKAAEEKLSQYFQQSLAEDVQLKKWSPSNFVLRSVASQGEYRDSSANIHGLAILAYRSGWSSFIVADELTNRQLNGNTRGGEKSNIISVTMVAVRPGLAKTSTTTKSEKQTQDNDQVRVIAKRTTGAKGENATLIETLDTFNISQKYLGEYPPRHSKVFTEFGLELHDPDRRLFSVDTATSLGREESLRAVQAILPAHIDLPAELTSNIISYADEDVTQPIQIPPWVCENSGKLDIFLLFPTTEEQLHSTHSAIQHAVHVWYQQHQDQEKDKQNEDYDSDDHKGMHRELQLQLIPWQHHRVASRRDLVRLWQTYRDQTLASKMQLLLEPVKTQVDVNSAHFGTLYSDDHEPNLVSRNTLDAIIRETQNRYNTDTYDKVTEELHGDNKLLDPEYMECMVVPDSPFYANPPPWLPIDREMNSIALFYLTNKLTEEQRTALQQEIQTLTDVDVEDYGWRKVCCFVPWKSGEEDEADGGLEDIWDIFWKHTSYRGSHGYCQAPLFFVDQQSGIDQTVMMVDADLILERVEDTISAEGRELLKDVPHPELKGFVYGRVAGREAHIAFANINIANMNFEEFTEPNSFPRPGWPGQWLL